MIYTCVIITEDTEEVKLLKNQISLNEELSLITNFDNIYHVPANIYGHIAFVNINDTVITGYEQIKLMKSNFEFIIFTGCNPELAAIAYDMDGLDYLSKPIDPLRFNQTFTKITRSVRNEQKARITLDNLFVIKDAENEHGWVFNNYRDVMVVESNKNYLKIYTTTNCHTTHMALSEFEFNVLNFPDFIRVHRSFIISKNHIRKITRDSIYMKNANNKIPIGGKYRKNLQEFIDSISLNK